MSLIKYEVTIQYDEHTRGTLMPGQVDRIIIKRQGLLVEIHEDEDGRFIVEGMPVEEKAP